MKKHIDAAIIVEGKTDAALLSSIIDAEIITTNGSDVPRGTIDYIATLSKIKTIIVFTDPDGPGTAIRHKLDAAVPNLRHAFLTKHLAVRNGKVGVAEAAPEDILAALEQTIPTNTNSVGCLTIADLQEVGLIGTPAAAHNRAEVSTYFHLGHNNGKQLLFRLNNLNITREAILTAIQESATHV